MGGYMPAPGFTPPAQFGGFWIRVVAYIIDAIILGIVNAVIDAILQVNPQNPQSATYGVAVTLEIVLSLAYFAGLWTYMGATLVAIGRKSPRISAGAAGFISHRSIWLGPPSRYTRMHACALPCALASSARRNWLRFISRRINEPTRMKDRREF